MSQGPQWAAFLAGALRARRIGLAVCTPTAADTPLAARLRAAKVRTPVVAPALAGAMAIALSQWTQQTAVLLVHSPEDIDAIAPSLADAKRLARPLLVLVTGARAEAARIQAVSRRWVSLAPEVCGMQLLTAFVANERQTPGPIVLTGAPEVLDAEVRGVPDGFARLLPRVPDVSHAARLLRAAKRPLLLIGPADRSIAAANGIRRLAEVAGAVVVAHPAAAGLADEEAASFAGKHPSGPPEALRERCDLLLAVGWETALPDATTCIRVHPYPTTTADLVGPTMETLDALRVAAFGETTATRRAWHRAAHGPPTPEEPHDPPPASAQRLGDVQERLPRGARFITPEHPAVRALVVRTPMDLHIADSPRDALIAGIASRWVEPTLPVVVVVEDLPDLRVLDGLAEDLVVWVEPLSGAGTSIAEPHVQIPEAAQQRVGIKVLMA